MVLKRGRVIQDVEDGDGHGVVNDRLAEDQDVQERVYVQVRISCQGRHRVYCRYQDAVGEGCARVVDAMNVAGGQDEATDNQHGDQRTEDREEEDVAQLRGEIPASQRPARLEDDDRQEQEAEHGLVDQGILLNGHVADVPLQKKAEEATNEDDHQGLRDNCHVLLVQKVAYNENQQEGARHKQDHEFSIQGHVFEEVMLEHCDGGLDIGGLFAGLLQGCLPQGGKGSHGRPATSTSLGRIS
mmetsp:Transcript_8114/g.17141  ORF Transcript_8114/g.17141 Transcript_8114/m.17141 type:complete len:242 (-) Transcript_8114:2-727(-)